MIQGIKSSLDNIAALLSGAPPGPEVSLFNEKYIYSKEDNLTWVLELLDKLCIEYEQAPSLINGLYEIRCNTTNEQFNQVISKISSSLMPVLATYKKQDQFSDLVGTNIYDMEKYSPGYDSRVSLSPTVTPEFIKYWLNVNNGKIVQRMIDLAGSAAIGSYSIDYTGPGNIISGAVPINGSIRDNIQYKNTIQDPLFNYTLLNCTIQGWIFDLKKKPGDRTQGADTSGSHANITNAHDAIDDNMGTSCNAWTGGPDYNEGYLQKSSFHADLGEAYDLSEIHLAFQYSGHNIAPYSGVRFEISEDNLNWTSVYSSPSTGGTGYLYPHISGSWPGIRYIRWFHWCINGNWPSYAYFYDLSVFE